MPHDEQDERTSTGKLNSQQRQAFTVPTVKGYGMRFTPHDIDFQPVPSHYHRIEDPDTWFVLFKFAEPAPRVTLGLVIYDDVVMGRGSDSGKSMPDVDLTNLDAKQLGVSRRHALIRPTGRNLFLIDLGSTNGTYVNTIPVSKGMAQAIRTADTVSLAGLIFEVEIVATPEDDVTAADLRSVDYASEDDPLHPLTAMIAGFSDVPAESPGESTLIMDREDDDTLPPANRSEQSRLSRLRASMRKEDSDENENRPS
ncbi:MAG: FHA domain-containing protein [Chloroflexi bacterium]|nr:FHA domain-containing protein [Chloroflexota bacterium]